MFQPNGGIFGLWIIACLPPLLFSPPAIPGQVYTSTNGFATITFGDQCSTSRPMAGYQFRDGTKGVLTATNCAQQGGDVFTYRFRDTSGTSRCLGSMTMTFGGRSGFKVLTRWEVQGAVPGYSYSQSGKSYTLEMKYPPSTLR